MWIRIVMVVEIKNYRFRCIFRDSMEFKSGTPPIICTICVTQLRLWTKREKKVVFFSRSMMSRESINHVDIVIFDKAMLKV